MNTTEHIYSVYSQNGMLLNKVNYGDKISQYGEPIAASSNGVSFVFQKNLSSMHENYLKFVVASVFTKKKVDK